MAAALVRAAGFFLEVVGDAQMARIKVEPANRGQVLNTGVWRTTRHPNHVGNATQGWAYYLVAAAGGPLAVLSPILMSTLLLCVPGVALLERMLREANPQYKAYIETTSTSIPWFARTE